MIGQTLGLYFFRRYIGITAWFITGITLLAFLIDFTEFSSRTSGLPKYTMGGALLVSALHMPVLMQQIIPFIALFGGMTTLISLNRKYELVIARASGISAWQFLLPACAGAFLVGVATVAILNPLAAWGFEKSTAIEADWRSRASNKTVAQQIPWMRQRTDEGETIIGAKAVLQQGSVLSDAVFIRLDKDGGITRRHDARRAVLRDGFWLLQDAVTAEPGKKPQSDKELRVATNLKLEYVEQRLADPESVPFYSLFNKIAVSKSFGYPAFPLRMQLHSLLALPALLVAMTLIAATVSLKFVRFGQSVTMIVGGIAAGFLLYVVSILVKAFGSTGFVPPVAAAWFPVVVAAFVGVSFLLHKEDG